MGGFLFFLRSAAAAMVRFFCSFEIRGRGGRGRSSSSPLEALPAKKAATPRTARMATPPTPTPPSSARGADKREVRARGERGRRPPCARVAPSGARSSGAAATTVAARARRRAGEDTCGGKATRKSQRECREGARRGGTTAIARDATCDVSPSARREVARAGEDAAGDAPVRRASRRRRRSRARPLMRVRCRGGPRAGERAFVMRAEEVPFPPTRCKPLLPRVCWHRSDSSHEGAAVPRTILVSTPDWSPARGAILA